MAFQKAVRKKAKLRLALCGPSGSGKTYTALRLAMALCPPGGRIAVLDTERGSASLYAGQLDPDDRVTFTFDVSEPPDYSPITFVRSIREAAEAGYDVLILDSITHAWEGVKDEADKGAARKNGNTWAGWSDARPKEKQMIDAMLTFPGHVIATMRVKTVWEVGEGKGGKKTYQKIGLAPEQKAGIEYEFTVTMDLDTDHQGVVTKSRCSAVADAVVSKPGAPFALQLLAWLDGGEGEPAKTQPPAREAPREPPTDAAPATEPKSQPERQATSSGETGATVDGVRAYLRERISRLFPGAHDSACFDSAEVKLFKMGLEDLPEQSLARAHGRLEKTPDERLHELLEPCFVPF